MCAVEVVVAVIVKIVVVVLVVEVVVVVVVVVVILLVVIPNGYRTYMEMLHLNVLNKSTALTPWNVLYFSDHL